MSPGPVLNKCDIAPLGSTVAIIGGRWLQPHLFDTAALDPTIFGAVAITLLVVAVVAGWLPARRAVRISPTGALRAE